MQMDAAANMVREKDCNQHEAAILKTHKMFSSVDAPYPCS